MKIIILILSTKNKDYDCFKKAIKETWFKDFTKVGIKCFFYEGNSKKNILIDDTIYLNCDDSLQGTSKKLKLALDFVDKNYEYDFIFRTNLSSYLDIKKFLNYINHFRISENTYSGLHAQTYSFKEYFWKNNLIFKVLSKLRFNFGKKIDFASGSGFFLGRNNVKKILRSKKFENYVDDVMVGLICKLDQIYHPPRIDIGNMEKPKILINQKLSSLKNDHAYHFRFKSKDRIKDSENLKICHNENSRIELIKRDYDS